MHQQLLTLQASLQHVTEERNIAQHEGLQMQKQLAALQKETHQTQQDTTDVLNVRTMDIGG
jgi:hypothetical protein